MNAGDLKEVVRIFKPSITKNEYGEQLQDYKEVYKTKSQVKYNSGNRNISNDEVITNYTKIFIVRHYIDVKENYIIEWNNQRYKILSIENNKQQYYKQILTELINE